MLVLARGKTRKNRPQLSFYGQDNQLQRLQLENSQHTERRICPALAELWEFTPHGSITFLSTPKKSFGYFIHITIWQAANTVTVSGKWKKPFSEWQELHKHCTDLREWDPRFHAKKLQSQHCKYLLSNNPSAPNHEIKHCAQHTALQQNSLLILQIFIHLKTPLTHDQQIYTCA